MFVADVSVRAHRGRRDRQHRSDGAACLESPELSSRTSGPDGDDVEVTFKPDEDISERVIFPVTESQSNGIEDARFVQFR